MRLRQLGILVPGLLFSAVIGTLMAQAPAGDGIAAPQPPAPVRGGGPPAGGQGAGNRLGEAAPIDNAAADRGAPVFRSACAFCHGVDARGGLGPDLGRSLFVIADPDATQLAAYLKVGRPATGMPAFPDMTAADVRDMSSFLRRLLVSARTRPGLDPASIVVGDAAKGAAYFNGEGRCSTCHSPTGDLRGVGARYNPMVLQGRMINPRAVTPGRGGPPAKPLPRAKVRVTMPNGNVVAGDLLSVNDFFVTLQDADGSRRTIARDNDVPKVEIDDPLEAHRQQMLKYTDEIMHNLTAYLVSLK